MKLNNGINAGDTITQFIDKYRWLSNFYLLPNPIIYDNMSFNSVENFYQAMKSKDREYRLVVSNVPSYAAKKLGSQVVIREDWEDIKIKVMRYALNEKFSDYNSDLKQKLIDTYPRELQEGNYWGDRFWGICLKTGEGENNLGELLMDIRYNLIK